MKHTIGQNIAYYRKQAGYTQEELAEKMNVTAQAVSKWENDLSYPDLECVGRLARVLDTMVESIVTGEAAEARVRLSDEQKTQGKILKITVHNRAKRDFSVTVRFPLELVLRAAEDGTLGELLGEDAVSGVTAGISAMKSGTVGTIVDVRSDEQDVTIEVIEYDN